jgi:type I restriction enzyme S subunit
MFRKETEFQGTEIGEFPKDWEIKKLREIAKIETGKREKGGGKETGEVISLGGENISLDGKLILNPSKYISKEFYNSLKSGKVKEKDILLVKDGATTGKAAFVEKLPAKEVAVNEHLFIIRGYNVDQKFLYYIIISKIFQNQIKSLFHGIIGGITKAEIEEVYIPLPPLEEQKRIADILSIIDSGIETVDRAVAKLEGMKRALLNELLTGRIRVREENGKLTFYKETEFQDTEIGKIPKDWKTEKLSSLATIIMGQSPPSTTYNKEGEGLPFIQGKMEFGKMYPSPTTYTSRPLKIAEKGDVLMSVRAPVGDVNIAPYKLCIGRGLAAIRFNPKMANNLFYFYYLQSIKSRLESLGKGSTFKAITKKDLEELRIVYLPLNEQKGIANILLTIDNAIELYYREKERLLRLRRGLMSVLLTGRVRVIGDVKNVGVVT